MKAVRSLALALSCVMICFLLASCSDENEDKVDPNSASYQQGYEDGLKAGANSVFDNPEDNGLISKEDAEEYVQDQIDPADAENMQDIIDEYAEDYGYHK